MAHVDEGSLQAFLDRELSGAEQVSVMRHVAACGSCAGELEELRARAELFGSAVRRLDSPAPVAEAAVAVRRRMGERGIAADAGVRGTPTRRTLLRAATMVLGFAAAASAAVPGSPVRAWLVSAWDEVRGAAAVSQPSPTATPTPEPGAAPAADERLAGVSILPADGHVRILLESSPRDSRVRVRLVDEARTTVAAPAASFRTAPGRIDVVGGRYDEVLISLPRALASASVEVGDRVYLVKDGRDLRVLAPAESRSDAEVVFRLE